jgi:hypothetical protein
MTKAGEARIPQPVSVKIFAPPGVPPTVVPDSVLLSKGAHHEVVWTCEPPQQFEVKMKGASPFAGGRFTEINNHSGESIVVGDGSEYKYSVVVGGRVVDPGVIINP